MRPHSFALDAALLRGISAAAGLAGQDGPRLVIEELRSRDWSSATFVGARHSFDLRIEGEPAAVGAAWARLQARLADWEFVIPGHIVAEAALEPPDAGQASETSVGVPNGLQSFTVNLLTIID